MAKKARVLTLDFPLAGLDRAGARRQQAPYTCEDAQNVWPRDAEEGRSRGGSRPGLNRPFGYNSSDTDQPVRLLTQIRSLGKDNSEEGFDFWTDTFDGDTLGTVWDSANHTWAGTGTPTITDGCYRAGTTQCGAVFEQPSELDINTAAAGNKPIALEAQIRPYNGGYGGEFYLFAHLFQSGASAYYQNVSARGLMFKLVVAVDGTVDTANSKLYGYEYDAAFADWEIPISTDTASYTLDPACPHRILLDVRLDGSTGPWSGVSGHHTMNIWFDSDKVLTVQWETVDTDPYHIRTNGKGWGFAAKATTASYVQIDAVRMSYFHALANYGGSDAPEVQKQYRTDVVSSANGVIYRQDVRGMMNVAVSTIGTGGTPLNASVPLQAVSREGELIIADHGDIVWSGLAQPQNGGTFLMEIDFTTSAGVADPISSGTASAITEACVTDGSHVLELSWETLPAHMLAGITDRFPGTYQMLTCTTTTIQFVAPGTYVWSSADATNVVTNGGVLRVTIRRGPKIYNPHTGVVRPYTEPSGYASGAGIASGSPPVVGTLVSSFLDRIVFASEDEYFMSAEGRPYDWDYGQAATDEQSAVAGVIGTLKGDTQKITALVPYLEQNLIFGCERSVWIQRGGPVLSGPASVSRNFGIIGPDAWAFVPGDYLVFMSHDGLMSLSPAALLQSGALAPPEPLSRDKLPRELLNLDQTDTNPILFYDSRMRGIWIILSNEKATSQRHWFFDWRFRSFWPMDFPSSLLVTAAANRTPNLGLANDGDMLLGFSNGSYRTMNWYAAKDHIQSGSFSEIDSYVYYGPFRLGNSDYLDGKLTELLAVLDDDSADVDWSLLPGDTIESARAASALGSGTFPGGQSYKFRPRTRGQTVFLKLAGSSTRKLPWAVERITAKFVEAGKARLA